MNDENNIKRFTLRLDKALFEAIKKQAITNHRATGKEIEHILEQNIKK